MKLEYCYNPSLNFGDDLNLWLWPRLIPDLLDEDPKNILVGIGSLLTERRMVRRLGAADTISVFSSGAWGPDAPSPKENWRIYGVRGPLTAKWLNISKKKVIGDGAYLLRSFYSDAVIKTSSSVGFIPHHRSEDFLDWQPICDAAGVKFISPKQSVETFLQEMGNCTAIIAEAMHGAIAADALRIPWIPARFSPRFEEGKWQDWAASMGVSLRFETFPFAQENRPSLFKNVGNMVKRGLATSTGFRQNEWQKLPINFRRADKQAFEVLSHRLSVIAESGRPSLSTDTQVRRIHDRLLEQIEALKADNQNLTGYR